MTKLSDKALRDMLTKSDERIQLGESFRTDDIKIILLKDDELDIFSETGRVICTLCKVIMSHCDGSHITRHLDLYCKNKRARQPSTEKENQAAGSGEPVAKNRKIIEFTAKRFQNLQVEKLTDAIGKYCVRSGRSYNHLSSMEFKSLIIDVANACVGSYTEEAAKQLPHRDTIQKKASAISEKLIKRGFDFLRPFIEKKRVNLLVDHGKIVTNYLSIIASFIDDDFKLQTIPIGFAPALEGKSGNETAKLITEKLVAFGWEEEKVRECCITADGALRTLSSSFQTYIRCASHSLSLVVERIVLPKEAIKMNLQTELDHLASAERILKSAQIVATSIRINSNVCKEMSRLPTLPNETRWMNGLKCLMDVQELSEEISKVTSQFSTRGRQAFNHLVDSQPQVKALLCVLEPLLEYNTLFQNQKSVVLHLILPAYKRLQKLWGKYKHGEFGDLDIDGIDTELMKALSTSGVLCCQEYYNEFGDIHLAAVLLCPRTKKMTHFEQFEKTEAKSFVLNELADYEIATDSKIMTEPAKLPRHYRELSDCPDETSENDELLRYMNEHVDFDSAESLEEYWLRKKKELPNLFEVSCQVFSVVPSEAACESAFSVAGFLLDKRRTRLQSATAEKIVVGSQINSRFPEWLME